jgi:hypothetical protein
LRRTVLSLGSLVAVSALLTGCGGDDTNTSSAESSPSATGSASESASESATPSAAAPTGCEPPAQDVEYTSGSATLDVTAGPDTGQYELTLDDGRSSAYAAEDKEITGYWLSADEQAVLFIDIEGADPCQPDAFTSIGTQGAGGPVFIDSSHTACTVEVTSLGAEGVQGTFACTGLTGGGEGLERDASGTFTLTT